MHEAFDEVLEPLIHAGVGFDSLGEVLARVAFAAPAEVTRVELTSAEFPTRGRRSSLSAPSVSRAVRALTTGGFLAEGLWPAKGSNGRPALPLRFSDHWVIAGVKLERVRRENFATVTLNSLNRQVLDKHLRQPIPRDRAKSWQDVANFVVQAVEETWRSYLKKLSSSSETHPDLLGIGVEIGGHVLHGKVVESTDPRIASDPSVPLGDLIQAAMNVPVEVENDVNALAVWEIYQPEHHEADLAVVAVFEEGVGGGLVLDGALRRGGRGRAMEIGHVSVDHHRRPRSETTSLGGDGFDAPCACGEYGHVDALATPMRFEGELGLSGWREIASGLSASGDARIPHAAIKVFSDGGAALGRGIAAATTTTDPARLIVYLPAELTTAASDAPGAAYVRSLKEELHRGYFGSTRTIPCTWRFVGTTEMAILGSRAAALCLLHALIEHARGRDHCPSPRASRLSIAARD
jgi:predicted NBD/HSP70 family sugar kinase